jgi:hypothetical protein
MIFFKNGNVVHAMCDSESGESAFFKILTFQGGSLQNIRGVEPPVMSIKKGLESLLLEAASRSDEGTTKYSAGKAQHTEIEDLDFDFLDSENAQETVCVETAVPEEIITSDIVRDELSTTTAEEAFEMTKIQQILAEFTNIEGVHTACLVGRDGFLLDSLARPGIDTEMIAAIASSGFGSAESMGNQLGQGDLNMTMFEYGNGPVMFAPVGSEAFLVIVADKDTNLGWIRIAIRKNSKRIEEIAAF